MRGQNWLRVNESVLSPDEASKSNSLRGSPVAKSGKKSIRSNGPPQTLSTLSRMYPWAFLVCLSHLNILEPENVRGLK
jgi:hypothetical protein